MCLEAVRVSERLMAQAAHKVVDVGVQGNVLHQCHLASEATVAVRAVVLVDASVRVSVRLVPSLCRERLVARRACKLATKWRRHDSRQRWEKQRRR